MKIVQKTSRLLQLKQTNWLPWYGHVLLWPVVGILLLLSIAGESSTLTCSRSSGQCQLNNEVIPTALKRSIPLDGITKVDVIATDSTSESPEAQMVMITKDGEFNVGLSGKFEERDQAAGKLAWFFEDSSSQFIELKESSKPITGFLGLTGLGMTMASLMLRKTAVVSFDKDAEHCIVQLSSLFGLIKGRRETCDLRHLKNVELSGSLKVAADRILVQQTSGANFFLTDYATKDPRIELTAVNHIKDFLNLPSQKATAQDNFSAEHGWTEETMVGESNTAEFYSSSPEYSTTESSSADFYSSPAESSSGSSYSDSSPSDSSSSDGGSSSSND